MGQVLLRGVESATMTRVNSQALLVMEQECPRGLAVLADPEARDPLLERLGGGVPHAVLGHDFPEQPAGQIEIRAKDGPGWDYRLWLLIDARAQTSGMVWYFRLIEQLDGSWACRHGHQEFDVHADLDHAVEHLRTLAEAARPAELFLHHLNGTVDHYGTI